MPGRIRTGNWKDYVSASQLAELGYCEVAAVMRHRSGERATPHQLQRQREGKAAHAAFDGMARAFHNHAPETVRDTRCFIASTVYGPDDPRTEELRQFRDEVLLRRRLGRWLVVAYYRTSPGVARWIARGAWRKHLVTKWLDLIRHRVCRSR